MYTTITIIIFIIVFGAVLAFNHSAAINNKKYDEIVEKSLKEKESK